MAMNKVITLEALWQQAGFKPNDEQKQAVLHIEGPVSIPAGPGSGKTRVFHGVKPEEILVPYLAPPVKTRPDASSPVFCFNRRSAL
jgi:hypothetical protein